MKLENFIYLEARRFVFAYVPKVACTNWKALLRHLSGFQDYLDSSLAHDRVRSGLSFLSDNPRSAEILANSTIKKYAFVRNPFTRALSAYLNKVEPYVRGDTAWQLQYYAKIFSAIDDYRKRTSAPSSAVTFAVFLDWIARSGDPLTQGDHWLPQSRILSPSIVRYDFLGRFEKLQHDASILMRLIDCDVPFPTREALDFPGTNSEQQIAAYYSETEIDLVRKIYSEDFSAFAYSSEAPPA